MHEESPLFFCIETEIEGGFLSPWFKAPFTDGNITYQSAGHAILAEKVRLSGDTKVLERILAAETREEQITLGDSVKESDGSLWQDSAFMAAKRANLAKFKNVDLWFLKDWLKATGQRELVFASPSDRLLGIGFEADKAKQTSREQWGQNLFGKSLEAVRKEIIPFDTSIFDKGGRLEIFW